MPKFEIHEISNRSPNTRQRKTGFRASRTPAGKPDRNRTEYSRPSLISSMASDAGGFAGLPHPWEPNKPLVRLKTPNKIPDSVARFMKSVADHISAPLTEISIKIRQETQNSFAAMCGFQGPVLFANMAVSSSTWSQLRSSPAGDDNGNSNDNRNIRRASPSRSSRKRGAAGFPTNVRIDGIDAGNNRGPAFLGQVFSLCNPSGTGLMAVSRSCELPFGIKTPEWVKKIFSMITNNDMDGVFRFFLDIGDAVAYVERLNIPHGMVGACRLGVAYKHFKENPHMFHFVPNEKQVKEANKLLGNKSWQRGRNQLKGVPVFTAQNFSIAIATTNGIRWFTPYFFNKKMLDDILEASVDDHFQSLIQNRYIQRRREMVDDDFPTDMIEEHLESFFEPPEVDELMEEIGQAGIPLTSIISKAAEVHLYDIADRLLLGNRWIRKVTGIQPKFPFKVDSFEERSDVAVSRARELSLAIAPDVKGELETDLEKERAHTTSSVSAFEETEKPNESQLSSFSQKSKKLGVAQEERISKSEFSASVSGRGSSEQNFSDHILPRIVIAGISTSEPYRNKASMKQTMEKLRKEIEEYESRKDSDEDKDPLFVANVTDFSDFVSPNSDLEERE